jgi:hypothetical protein
MKSYFFHSLITFCYALFLVAIYEVEVSVIFGYMGFSPLRSVVETASVILLAMIFSCILSFKKDFINLIRIMIHYVFFVPGLIISATHNASGHYFFILIMMYVLILFGSAFPLRSFRFFNLSRKQVFIILFAMLASTIGLLVMYGGMENFNLNLLEVYKYRRESSASMPAVFGYFFSGVSKIVAPLMLALAIYFRSMSLALVSVVMTVLMFGMTHHKSILLLPLIVGGIYYVLQFRKSVIFMSLGFVAISIISAFEVFVNYLSGSQAPALFTSIIVRRVLFVPSLLDSIYVEYFLGSPKILWATSKFSLGMVQSPYDVTAPFLIGRDIFLSDSMSANAGIIGSGFSHAGVVGVAIYSIIFGLMISLFHAFGKVIGHELVFAASVSVMMSIVTSTDLTTAILTHGLLLLLFILFIFPRNRKIGSVNSQGYA